MELRKLLLHINEKVSLTEPEESIIASKLKQKIYLKNQYVVQEGDIYKYQTFVLSGKVRTFYLDKDGNEHIVAFGIENWWIGDICSFATQAPAEFNTQCLEKTTVVQISLSDMEELYRTIPKLERYFRLTIQSAYGNMVYPQ